MSLESTTLVIIFATKDGIKNTKILTFRQISSANIWKRIECYIEIFVAVLMS